MNLPDLDLRHLGAPQPMLRALVAADALGAGDSVAVLTPMLPRPLLLELALRGFDTDPVLLDDGCARVIIRRLGDGEAAD
ncbi:MAG: hypothetical protein ABI300_04610 [Rhodanobacter sp.]